MDIDIDTDIDIDVNIDMDIDIITYTTYILDNIDIECIGSWFSFPVLLTIQLQTQSHDRPCQHRQAPEEPALFLSLSHRCRLLNTLILLFFNTLIRCMCSLKCFK